MPRNIIYGVVGIGTEQNPAIIRVIDSTSIPTNGNTSGALSSSGAPFPSTGCLGNPVTPLTMTVAGITICTEDFPDATDPNGVFSLPFFQLFPASGGGQAYCQYQVIVAGNAYVFIIFANGLTAANVLLGGFSGADYFEGGSTFGSTMNNEFVGPCQSNPDTPGFGGTVDASF